MMKKEKNDNIIQSNMLFDNAPNRSDNYQIEAQVLDTQIKKSGVNNIAVVAPYGAGKSSAITTYIHDYRPKGFCKPKYVQISLADFNQENTNENSQSHYNENAIERSILQQLLYSQKKYKLPNSTLNRTNKSRIGVTIFYFFMVAAFLFSATVFSFEIFGKSIFPVFNSIVVQAVTFITGIFTLSILLIYFVYTGKLKKIKYKDLEIGVNGETQQRENYSLINKFIDEVLYFFECINVDLVIFEDLDRLESLEIFVKLRELNTIINNSPRKAKKITFLYAVKDTMFKDEKQRAKFFEFILPIIPIINPITTENQIFALHKQMISFDQSLKLSEQFIKDIAFFVSDMRVLKNTFNDYIIMAKKLLDNDNHVLPVKKENLFALALYKNLFPYDYSRLQNNNGLIPLCVNKEKLIRYYKESEMEKIKELELEKEKIQKEWLSTFAELKLVFKGQHYAFPYEYNNAPDVDSITTFKDKIYLAHPVQTSCRVRVRALSNSITYYEREKILYAKTANKLDEIEKEIQRHNRELGDIENESFLSLLKTFGIEEYFSEDFLLKLEEDYKTILANEVFEFKQTNEILDKQLFDSQVDYIRMLLNKGYLDDNYLEYLSNNQSDILSLKDRTFIRNVKKGHMNSFHYRLDNVKEVIRKLDENDFLQKAVLIQDIYLSFDLIREIDNENSIKTKKFDNIMSLFASGDERVVQLTINFLQIAQQEDKIVFADNIAKNAPKLISKLFTADLSIDNYELLVKALIRNLDHEAMTAPAIKRFIAEHTHYTELFTDLDTEQAKSLINSVNVEFKQLDITNGKDTLYEFIVENGLFVLNIENIKTILSLNDTTISDFERKNYSYMLGCGNRVLIEKINENLNDYFENVFLKLPISNESAEVIVELLHQQKIDTNIKNKIILHTDFKLSNLSDIDKQFYPIILAENKLIPLWKNIGVAYATLDFSSELRDYIIANCSEINDAFMELEKEVQTKLFNAIITAELEKSILKMLASKINISIKMDEAYGNNPNIESFILAGRFVYNVKDMQFLTNIVNQFSYFIVYQKEILKDMQKFFADSSFCPDFCKKMLQENQLSLRFKKAFWLHCGDAVDINGIEESLADYLLKNSCNFSEGLLYKFTDVSLNPEIKFELLKSLIEKDKITNLREFQNYFCSISSEYTKYKEGKGSVKLPDCEPYKTITEFMKQKGFAKVRKRNNYLYIHSY